MAQYALLAGKTSCYLLHYNHWFQQLSCRKIHNTDPVGWAQVYTSKHDHTFWYSHNMGISSLQGHIHHYHLLEYINLAKENGWQIFLQSVKSTMAYGYLLSKIWNALADSKSLASPEATSPSKCASIPPFSLYTITLWLFLLWTIRYKPCCHWELILNTIFSLLTSLNAKISTSCSFFIIKTSRICRYLIVWSSIKISSRHGRNTSQSWKRILLCGRYL